jgi:pantetheine-phosphate adenylyltransferase
MEERLQHKDIIAVYPGTFDPVTNGHLDIIERSSDLFHRVLVAVLRNRQKSPLFSPEERMEMIQIATGRWANVTVESFEGLLVDYALQKGAQVIIRGIRAVSDYEYELQMASMNRRLAPGLETVFMFPTETYSYLSSGLVKEICLLGGSLNGLVPPEVETRLRRISPPTSCGRS